MSSPSYAPGTIVRAYNAEKTLHNTAVLLKNGEWLELKIFGYPASRRLPTYECWYGHRRFEGGSLEVDTSRAYGAVIANDFHGFNTRHDDRYDWFYWCYTMIAEAAPELLTNSAVRDAFNALKELADKHKYHSRYVCNGPSHRYNADLLRLNTGGDRTQGFYVYPTTHMSRENPGPEAVGAAYKALYDLLAEKLLPFMKEKHERFDREHKIRIAEARKRHVEKKIRQLREQVEGYERYLAKLTAKEAQ